MKLTKYTVALAILLGITTGVSADSHSNTLTLHSVQISEGKTLNNEQVFAGFGCEGGNLSPALNWDNVPEGTASFVLTAYDPDAPTGSGWWHWSVINIPADVTALPKGVTSDDGLPDGAIELRNDYGVVGFGGACPPPGEVHRYQFTIYAMPTMLDLDGSVSNALVGFMVNSQAIASSTITAIYNR